MGRKAILSRESITRAGMKVVEKDGPQALTLKRLGETLGVDSTALYRHFRNKDELLSAIADQTLEGRIPDPGDDVPWREGIFALCVRLREAYLAQPVVADIVRYGPPRQGNELKLTETLLRLLRRGGIDGAEAGHAYHALIGLSLGAAALDAPVARLPAGERERLYAAWRRQYAALDAADNPNTVELARVMWVGTAEDRFKAALGIMLDGLEARVRRRGGISHRD
jgi:TetR/AcrR family tetracycline transcriptional repressor